MKKQFISDVKAGDAIDDIFVLQEMSLARKKDGGSFLNIVLADKTGYLKGVVWDRVDQISSAGISSGDFVQVTGHVNVYRGDLQLVVKEMAGLSAESVQAIDFLPATSHDVENMFGRLVSLTASVKTVHIRQLLETFWTDAEFVVKFKSAPAAKNMHHAYVGGLLEHTLSMALLVDRIAGHYSGIHMDLLLAGVILHDIGKIREFVYDHRIDYTDEGRLLSHIVIGLQMVDEKIRSIKGFPSEEAVLLKHLIVSHHGTREFGSPELPKTIEAVLLNYIDEIDSKINGIRKFISSEVDGESWTSYHRLLGRHFYTGKKKEEGAN